MIETKVKVDGMMCGMCEAHVNDAVRRALPVKKVSSSHTKGETVILSEEALDEQALRDAINATGYEVKAVSSALCLKKGCLGLFRAQSNGSRFVWLPFEILALHRLG